MTERTTATELAAWVWECRTLLTEQAYPPATTREELAEAMSRAVVRAHERD